jgi:hypothetical protein
MVTKIKEVTIVQPRPRNRKQKLKETTSTSFQMDNQDTIKRLKEHLTLISSNHEKVIMEQSSLKNSHIYCVIHNISPQKYGILLEKYILNKFNYNRNNAKECNGDCSKNGNNFEVKVSLGGSTHTKFNYVQIRPSHRCETYILTAYHLSIDNVENEGELYIFKISKLELLKIVVDYGTYAHGTIKEHGIITHDSINIEKNKEYAIRTTYNDKCWKALLPFRIFDNEL